MPAASCPMDSSFWAWASCPLQGAAGRDVGRQQQEPLRVVTDTWLIGFRVTPRIQLLAVTGEVTEVIQPYVGC